MPTEFILELQKMQEPVWRVIEKYLPLKDPLGHYRMIRDYPERKGKYLRPSLVIWSCQAHGGSIEQALLTAAAMQVSEDWLLIHDDFEDHSLERRSTKEEYRPTLCVKHGDELAVNAGDALHIIMWKILGDTVRQIGPEGGWKIYDKMNEILLTTTEGQFLELDWIRNSRLSVSEEEYYEMVHRKAGCYTLIGPLQFGALAAGIDSEAEHRLIEEWAKPLGRAFQIQDDVMNLIEESEIQGKEKAGDILEGKRSLPLIRLVQEAQEKEMEEIVRIYSKKREEKTDEEKNFILDLMQKKGCIEYARQEGRKYAGEARVLFEQNTRNLPATGAKEHLSRMIDFIVERNR
jgi:geranylgeranyl diphosphate synthase, type II